MASAISVIMMILIGLVGGVPTLAITACIPVMLSLIHISEPTRH